MGSQNTFGKQIIRFVLFISLLVVGSCLATVVTAQTSNSHPEAAPSLDVKTISPPATRSFGMGTATGQGMGTASGTGMGRANGTGMGLANGSGLGGGPVTTVSMDLGIRPTSPRTFKPRNSTRQSVGTATGEGIGTATGAGVGTASMEAGGAADGTGIGKATGTGVGTTTGSATGTTTPAAAQDVRTYIKEMDGKCYYVTSLGEKAFVDRTKCELY